MVLVKEYSAKQWDSIFRQLIAAELLTVDIMGYGGLSLTAASRPILRGESTIYFRDDPKPQEQKTKASKSKKLPKESSSVTIDERLLQTLKSIRMQLARTQGVPPYVIFHDSTLIEMQAKRPKTLAEFAEITGVGQRKLERYGEVFLAALTKDT